MPAAPQLIHTEDLAPEQVEWYVSYLPHFGISSIVHFAVFVMAFALLPSTELKDAPKEIVKFTPVMPTKPPEPPAPPEPPKPPDLSTPAIRDIEDQEKVDMPQTAERNPVHEKDIEVSDHYETDDGEDGHGASGDPNAPRAEINTAFQIDNFVKGKGMPTVRGKGQGTGVNERFGHRGPGGRRNLTMAKGGGPRTESAVTHALEWLKRHQAQDGHWDAAGYESGCKGAKCTGKGEAAYNAGLTGLGLLAFLSHGDTSQTGSYQDVVRRGLGWIKGQQGSDGCIGPKDIEKHLYNHAIATMALAEAVAMGEYNLKDPAQRAVNYLIACQNPGSGWRYRNYNLPGTPSEADGNNDTSVTGWAVMALKSAKVADLVVPDTAFQGGSAWLDTIYQEDKANYSGTFGYLLKKDGKIGLVHNSPYTTTSVGVLVRLLMGQSKGVQEGVATLMTRVPEWGGGKANFYYWYYATLALFQMGGESWTRWNAPLKDVLCRNQATEGCADGSWDPAEDTWGDQGGRVYTTATGALCLEVYYRYKQGMKIHDSQAK